MKTIDIPVVDISDRNQNAAKELFSAATSHGFVFIENNEAGIGSEVIEDIFDLSKDFFSQPIDVKQQTAISSNEAGSNVGWLKQGVEKLDPATQKKPDVKEALNIPVPLLRSSRIPAPLESHSDLIYKFQQSCQALCDRFLRLLAISLSLEPEWFTSRHDQTLSASGVSGTLLRLLFYPSLSSSITLPGDEDINAEDVRAGAHSDYGSITLLFQRPGQPGLEIKDADGTWSSVPIDPAGALRQGKSLPILINIGDLLEHWTAGMLKSTVHRVVFPSGATGDRYSVVYFCHPLDDVVLEPVPSPLLKDKTESAKDNTHITAKQHLQSRLAATYHIDTK